MKYYKGKQIEILRKERKTNNYFVKLLEPLGTNNTGSELLVSFDSISDSDNYEVTRKDFNQIDLAYIPEPTIVFKPGDKVRIGNLDNCVILRSFENNRVYEVEYDCENKINKTVFRGSAFWEWLRIAPEISSCDPFANEDFFARSLNANLSMLLSRVFYFGVNFSPDYQRGYVWTQEQKEELIKTIFDNGSIGSFSFNYLKYKEGQPDYEIVDGKQRLSTICDYYCSKFPVNGVYFYQLSGIARSKFREHNVLIYDLQEANLETVYKLFLRINRRGTPVDYKHIEHVEKLLKELK